MYQNKSCKCLLILINVYCSKNQIVDIREGKKKNGFFFIFKDKTDLLVA